MKSVVFFALVASFLVGCSIEVSTNDLKKKKPPPSTPNTFHMKYSGGAHNTLNSTNVAAEVSIGMKTRKVTGAAVDAELTISSNRPE